MHRANVVIGGGSGSRRSTIVVEESDATATTTFVGVDGREDDFAVDDGIDEATTTTMINVKKECTNMDEDEDSKHQLQHPQQQHDTNEIEDVSK